MAIIGIDPGTAGALAWLPLEPWRSPDVVPMPATEAEVARVLRTWRGRGPVALVVLERARSSPQMGVVSAFTFGWRYGSIRGVLAALQLPFDEVAPMVWQRDLGCLSRGDKRVIHRRAQEIFPEVAVPPALADALLLAEWGRRRLVRGSRS